MVSVSPNSTHGAHRQPEVLRAQVHHLYENMRIAAVVTVFAAALLSALQWQAISHARVVGWFAAMSAVAFSRFAVAQCYSRALGALPIESWRRLAALGAGLAGVGWGAAGILLYPRFDLRYQLSLIFVLGGMMLGAATLLAPRRETFLAFMLPAGLGPTLRLLLEGDPMHLAMGLLAATFTISTMYSTWRIYVTIERSIRLNFENRDLSRELQEALEHVQGLNETLELKVQERTAELQWSTDQLLAEITRRERVAEELLRTQEALMNSEKLSVTARLADTMAHEINNPLAAITNLIFLLSPLQGSPEARAYVATLEKQVKRLSRIAAQMLKFHRDSNKPAEFTLEATLGDVLDVYRPLALKKGVTIRQSIETEGRMVGYKGEIIQVLTNLLSNAIEAVPSGGRIRVHLYSARCWWQESSGHCGFCLSILDNGRGIDPQSRPRIFEPFFTTKGDQGTGLGLWVCQGIISRAGGAMRVRSTQREGRSGTCVSVRLPVEAPAAVQVGRRRYEIV